MELCWRLTHGLSGLFHSQYAAALWEVHGLCISCPAHACPLVEQELIGCSWHAHLQALQSSSVHPPTLTHSPLPLPAPAEGTQGQVSWYKQFLPSVCRGEAKVKALSCVQRGTLPVSWKGQWQATATPWHSHSNKNHTTCIYTRSPVHTYTTHTYTIEQHTCILACSMVSNFIFIILFSTDVHTYNT